MNSTRRFIARIGSAFALFALLAFGTAHAASESFVFGNRTLLFTHVARTAAGTAVGVDDPAFRTLLKSLGATLTWHPGERYVLIATPQPLVVNFSVGSKRYDVGLLSSTATLAPFVQGSEVFLPLQELLRALALDPKPDGGATILQPQLTSIDVQGSGSQAIVVAHAALPLHPRVLHDGANRVVYAFDGVGSSIVGTRDVNAGGIRSMEVTTGGSVRDPRTTVTLVLSPRTRHDAPHSNNGDFEVAFGGNGGAPPLTAGEPVAATVETSPVDNAPQTNAAAAPPLPTPPPLDSSASNAGATVTGISVASAADGAAVTIAIDGNASYDWHRLREPDNRFWIDIHNAHLAGGPVDQAEANPLTAMRVRQNDAQTVRVALSIEGSKSLTVSPSATGIVINVSGRDVADAAGTGSGSTGSVVSANDPQALVTPVPPADYGQNVAGTGAYDSSWKFAPQGSYVPANPRLIVLDPGHGGGDRGSVHGGLQEAVLTLQMAHRVQQILIARGWQVKMTHDGDHDVHGTPHSQAEAESMGYTSPDAFDLQARDDIANAAGARLFVSIHCNAYINSGPHGTTYYYYKPSDLGLAEVMQHELGAADLGTSDDGVHKVKYYVIAHANMPAVLIETAFLSNPFDRARLASPEWQQKIAEAIADGIDQYAQAHPVSGQAQ